MKTLFLFLITMLSWNLQLFAYNESNVSDLYFSSADNDERSLIPNFNDGLPLLETHFFHLIDARGDFFTFEEVMSTLSPFLESKFETIIISNTATDGSTADIVPFQHLRVLNKINKNEPIFVRDRKTGMIKGLNFKNIQSLPGLPELVPVSSGISGKKKIRTFSGIFPIQMDKTFTGSTSTSHNALMSFPTYVKTYYSKKWSGVAIHGTPKKNHKHLGVRRDSGGCLRTFPEYAQIINSHVLSSEMFSKSIPAFSTTQNLPNQSVQTGANGTMEGSKALIIMFNGYNNPTSDI